MLRILTATSHNPNKEHKVALLPAHRSHQHHTPPTTPRRLSGDSPVLVLCLVLCMLCVC
jgi:hypothetical protein